MNQHTTTKSAKSSPIGATQIEEWLLARETSLPFHVVRIAVGKNYTKFRFMPSFFTISCLRHCDVFVTREGPFWVIQRVPQLRKFDNRRETFLRVFRVYIYVCIEREREREREKTETDN